MQRDMVGEAGAEGSHQAGAVGAIAEVAGTAADTVESTGAVVAAVVATVMETVADTVACEVAVVVAVEGKVAEEDTGSAAGCGEDTDHDQVEMNAGTFLLQKREKTLHCYCLCCNHQTTELLQLENSLGERVENENFYQSYFFQLVLSRQLFQLTSPIYATFVGI